MLVTYKMKYVQHWIDERGRKRYRVRRQVRRDDGKIVYRGGELPVNGDPSSPEFQAAYHAVLRGENMSDTGRPRFDPKNRAKIAVIVKNKDNTESKVNPWDTAPFPETKRRKTKAPRASDGGST